MYVRSSGLVANVAWYVSRLSTNSPYSMSSGRVPRPVRQNRCLSRASNSAGWNGVTQKSSNRSSRSSRSAKAHTGTSNRSGSSGRSRLRRLRHMAKAASGSSSAATTAPAHPSSGSRRVAASGVPAAFHGQLPRSSAWAKGGGAGSGKSSSGSIRPSPRSQDREVALDLERGDVGLVRVPFGALVADEPLEDMLAQGLSDELGLFHLDDRLLEGPGQRRDALGQPLLGCHLVQVGGQFGGQVVALLDAFEPGSEDHREGEIRVARRVR